MGAAHTCEKFKTLQRGLVSTGKAIFKGTCIVIQWEISQAIIYVSTLCVREVMAQASLCCAHMREDTHLALSSLTRQLN